MNESVDRLIHSLLAEGFQPDVPRVRATADAGGGRGVFSDVVRVSLDWPAGTDRPATVIVKVPTDGPNGDAAAATGACRREALAYREVLPRSSVRAPSCLAIRLDGDRASFLLEDLGDRRAVDQLDGLGVDDALAIAVSLAKLHKSWEGSPQLDRLDVRRATPATFDAAALAAGLAAMRSRWLDVVGERAIAAFEQLLDNRERLVERFANAGPHTLCHGDPRADNLVFDDDGVPVLFDWQQLAVQFGPADLAWLAATSLEPEVRREAESDLVSGYGTTIDDYRLGFVLPGLAVLLLCQRETPDARSRAFVSTSIERIATAISDLDVPSAD